MVLKRADTLLLLLLVSPPVLTHVFLIVFTFAEIQSTGKSSYDAPA